MSNDFHEARLSGERVYNGRIVRLDVDRVRLPGGGESTREVVRHRGAAVILPILEDGRIVFIRQYRYAVDEVLLELPAGTFEAAEEPAQCASRELAEETGYSARAFVELGSFYSTPGFTDEVLHAVSATGLSPTDDAVPDPDEQIDVVPLSPAAVFDRVAGGEIRDAKTMATLLLARLRGLI